MATTVITNSVKSHQWMLRLVGESLRTGYLVSKDLPTTFLVVTKGKIVSLQWTDLAHRLNQVTKGHIASNETNQQHVHFIRWVEKNSAAPLWYSCKKCII